MLITAEKQGTRRARKEAKRLLNSAASTFTHSLIGVYTAISNMYDEIGEARHRKKDMLK